MGEQSISPESCGCHILGTCATRRHCLIVAGHLALFCVVMIVVISWSLQCLVTWTHYWEGDDKPTPAAFRRSFPPIPVRKQLTDVKLLTDDPTEDTIDLSNNKQHIVVPVASTAGSSSHLGKS